MRVPSLNSGTLGTVKKRRSSTAAPSVCMILKGMMRLKPSLTTPIKALSLHLWTGVEKDRVASLTTADRIWEAMKRLKIKS